MVEKLSVREEAALLILRDDMEIYAGECLTIKTKSEGPKKLEFNRVQKYLHESFEDQKQRKGWVRKIIVKGRQQTCSTLIAGRFFHHAQFNPGTDVYIMSHEIKSTRGLFGKISLFNEKVREEYPLLSHATEIENRTEFEFTNKSTYSVGTAGEGNTGRSLTAKLFHGSEAAFWANPEEIKAGALQTVALAAGTEIILESTANGMNWFYDFAVRAQQGHGVYELIFIPWVWTDEYILPLNPGEIFIRSEEENKIAETLWNVHKWRVSDLQLNWRRAKVEELGIRKFKQEYPNTFEEAFQYSGQSFYDMDVVYKAMANVMPELPYGANILGVDVGRNRFINPNSNPDRTVLVWRKGRSIHRKKVYEEMRGTTLAGILADHIDSGECDHIFIDRAVGEEAYDILCERGYGRWITAIDFNGETMEDQYRNKRAEMACTFDEWLMEGGTHIINDKEIATDISMMPYWKLDSNSRKVFPSKDEMRKEFGRSPDVLDAIMLTFAFPVSADISESRMPRHTQNTKAGSSLTAQRQLRDWDTGRDRKTPGRRFLN